MNLPELQTLTELIRATAREELLPHFADIKREFKRDGSIVTAVDKAMQQRLATELAARWPDYLLLGEEMSSGHQADLIRTPGKGLWIVDPLDGTSNYTAGIPFFSVSVALMVDGEPVLGVVYDPSRDECFYARKGGGAWLNGRRLEAEPVGLPLQRSIAAIDFKRLPMALSARFVAAPPYASQRSFGSVALDWCWVAAGRFHVYLHGKQKLWDYAAGYLILHEAGGHSCSLAGECVFSDCGTPRSTVAALDEKLYREFRDWLEIDD